MIRMTLAELADAVGGTLEPARGDTGDTTVAGVVETIGGIERRMFYKSMTTFADSRVWQDVYHVPARGLMLYVKFQADIVTEFTVMSFKEK